MTKTGFPIKKFGNDNSPYPLSIRGGKKTKARFFLASLLRMTKTGFPIETFGNEKILGLCSGFSSSDNY